MYQISNEVKRPGLRYILENSKIFVWLLTARVLDSERRSAYQDSNERTFALLGLVYFSEKFKM